MDNKYIIGYQYKILLLGCSDTGKKELLDRYLDNPSSESTSSTIGIEIWYKDIVRDNKNIKIIFIDTAGQEKFRTITQSYLNGANAIILICDITNKNIFNNLRSRLRNVKECYPEGNIEIIIIANKIDLEIEKQISNNSIKEFAKKNNVQVLNASAKTGEGVQVAFHYLIIKLINNKNIGICEEDNDKRYFLFD